MGPTFTFDLLPKEQLAIPHFCIFRLVWDETRQKLRKLPHQVRTPEYGASSTNHDHWASFEEALAAYEKRAICGRIDDNSGVDPAPCDGIGWFFTKPFFGIDLDKVRDKETGVTEQWALDFMKKYPTYWELSISETGYHGIGHGKVPEVDDPKRPGLKKAAQVHVSRVEVYGGERFFVLTGWRV